MVRRVPTDTAPELLAASHWLLPVCSPWPLVRTEVEPCEEGDWSVSRLSRRGDWKWLPGPLFFSGSRASVRC